MTACSTRPPPASRSPSSRSGSRPSRSGPAFAPRQFYDDFPGGGRRWVAADGPYNEHLVRDVGAFSLALLVVAVFALVTLSVPLVRATAAAFLVSGVLHVGYHLRHLDLYDTADQVASIGGLLLGPVVAVILLVLTLRPREGRAFGPDGRAGLGARVGRPGLAAADVGSLAVVGLLAARSQATLLRLLAHGCLSRSGTGRPG